MRTDISRDFTALQQVERGALQPRESIRTCEWFTNRMERMQKNLDAFNDALGALTRNEDIRALRASDVQDVVLMHLISLSSDAEVDLALDEFIYDINHRPCGQSVDDVCKRHFGRSLLGDIRQWFARNEQVYQDRLQHQTRMDFVACLVAVVGVAGRRQVAAAYNAAVRALEAFRWLGTGRDPQNEIAQDNPGVRDPRADV